MGRRKWRALAVAVALTLAVASGAVGQGIEISGRYDLNTRMLPVPATLVSEIQLDAPAELTLLKFGIESSLDLSLTYGPLTTHLNTALSIPGLERFILDLAMPIGPAAATCEMWFAVPFETVTDINHFQNWVVIPPGDLQFVTARFTTSGDVGLLSIHNLFMIQDVNFPNPSRDFGSLQYPTQSQSFHAGDILTIKAEVYPGVTLTSVTNFCATSAGTSVKGWSAGGSVDSSSSLCDEFDFDSTLTLTGLQYCGVPFWIRLVVDPCDDPILELSGGGSFKGLFLHADLAGSFGLFPIGITGFTFTTVLCDIINATFVFSDEFEFTRASFGGRTTFESRMLEGSFSSSCTYIAGQGVTSLSFAATAAHGAFSGGLSWALSEQQDTLRLTSTTSHLSLSLAPVAISVSTSFGKSGLIQAALNVGVTF